MKKTFLLLGLALLVTFTGCSLFENLIPTESSVTFTLDGTSYSDDQTTINRAFAATQFADSTVATARVLDATTGNGMLITTIFTGEDGTYNVTAGLNDLALAIDRMSIQIWEGDFNSDSSNTWDASNVTLTVTNFTPNEDNSLVSFEATFTGTMINEDTEATAQVSNGSLIISAIGN
ncbi:MAG TPA: hypothetical protein DCE41_24830 [Cytophagales bacterium]|nr:hypothetical protein [Cytophagales bacterium]HAA23238.1 hypothetical protein [Cytophagales bacterium]HAP58472.1 hypothetical protein [Cytophagales bacterium]